MQEMKKNNEALRKPAELLFKKELTALIKTDQYPKPPNWRLSPKKVVDFIMGTELEDGTKISPKYFGQRSLIEIAVATLATDRALLLTGIPGTAKTWVSENLAAAISGSSRLLVQGTAGTHEEQLLYGWNYPILLAKGPVPEALVPSPIMRGMETGSIVRIEELTRMPFEIQDALITLLSEKSMPIPELDEESNAISGFNIIATANDRDKGIHEMSSALKRRFNTVVLPLPATIEMELEIVRSRIAPDLMAQRDKKADKSSIEEIKRVITIFKELRDGKTMDGKLSLKRPASTLSTAEIIGLVNNALAMAVYFGKRKIDGELLARNLKNTIVKNHDTDLIPWNEYVEMVMKKREEYDHFYQAVSSLK
ncbi:MAG: ATPase [Saprospirales bacterium]|nr:MAG: ATPase [Saprospirales bacterium]